MLNDKPLSPSPTQSKHDYIDYKMNKITLRNEDEINALTHKIIGCAMQVHSTMGNGFQYFKRVYNKNLVHPKIR